MRITGTLSSSTADTSPASESDAPKAGGPKRHSTLAATTEDVGTGRAKTPASGRSYPRGPHDKDPYSVLPPVAAGVKNNREDPLFKQYPLTGTYVSKSGIEMPLPYWHSYLGTSTIIQGTADIAVLEKLLAGTGYKPVRTDGDKGFVQLWFNDYKDTANVPYKAMPITIAVAREERTIPWKNAMSAAAPLTDPSLTSFLVTLPVSAGAQGPLDYGREILGMDKFETNIDISYDGKQTSISVRDLDGKAVLQAGVTADKGFFSGLGAVVGLVRNIGFGRFKELVRIGKNDEAVNAKGVTRAVELPGQPAMELTYASKLNPKSSSFRPEKDSFAAHPGTGLGNLILRMGFEPHAVSQDPNFRAVVVPGKVVA